MCPTKDKLFTFIAFLPGNFTSLIKTVIPIPIKAFQGVEVQVKATFKTSQGKNGEIPSKSGIKPTCAFQYRSL
jgi:hypothetical protein